jgi:LacI family transcriptional regulator, repressor for deo operon, udp, cdd, tsx, nupC, and nupG
MKAVTILDVAREANVSVATVSRVLSGKGPVSQARHRQVIEAVEKLGYSVGQNTRSGRQSGNRILLMIVPRISNPFYNEIIHGFQNAAYRFGYEVLLCQSMANPRRTEEYINLMKNRTADGAVLLNLVDSTELLSSIGENYPVVQCCEYNEDSGFSYVSIDNVQAARSVVQFLLSMGYRKIALLNSALQFRYARDRQAGYEAVLRENGIPVRPEYIAHISDINYSMALTAAESLLRQADQPEVVFAVSDVIAAAVIKAAKRLGLAVPRDVAVVGFDNTEISLMCDPSITTVNQPRYELGTCACEMLVEQINNPQAPRRQLLLATELIARESTMR